MEDETAVNIKKHKRKLESIRNARQSKQQLGDDFTSPIGFIQATAGSDERNTGNFERTESISGSDVERVEGKQGTFRQHGVGIRSPFAEDEHSATGGYRDDFEIGEAALIVEDAEDKQERERELNRQRVARYRDKKRQEGQSQAQNGVGNVTLSNVSGNGNFSFFAKKSNAEPVKLLTKTEADDARDALIYVYQKGSTLIDDLIEIITAGHEPVSIWALSEDEAAMFAEAHLKKAQKDVNAARSARMLLKIHDKLFLTQYVFTRAVATNRHIKNAGGLSFK